MACRTHRRRFAVGMMQETSGLTKTSLLHHEVSWFSKLRRLRPHKSQLLLQPLARPLPVRLQFGSTVPAIDRLEPFVIGLYVGGIFKVAPELPGAHIDDVLALQPRPSVPGIVLDESAFPGNPVVVIG